MAKKTGLAASLQQKKTIDIDVLQKNVEQLHPQNGNGNVFTAVEEELQKFQVFLPKEIHKKIKLHCTLEDLIIKDFCTEAIMDKAKKLKLI